MRRHRKLATIATCLVCLAFFAVAAIAAETKITIKDVPAAVAKAEKTKWPQAKIVGIEREEEDNKTIFEFGLTEGTRKWDASFNPEGEYVAVEEVIAAKEVPPAVKKGLEAKYPKPNILLVEKVSEGDEKSPKIFYEYKLKTGTGGLEVKLDAQGKILTEEAKKGDEINE